MRRLLAVAFAVLAVVPLAGGRASAAAPSTPAPAFVRIVNAAEATVDTGVDVVLDGEPKTHLSWATTTSWTTTSPGRHTLRVAAGPALHDLVATVDAECDTTVVLAQAHPTSSSIQPVVWTTCATTRIADGHARIDNLLVADTDLGNVRLSVSSLSSVATPLKPQPGADISPGLLPVVVGGPGGTETYMSERFAFAADVAYSVIWMGGGETPAQFLVLTDGRQPPNPPPPGIPINTGLPAPSGTSSLLGWFALAALGLLLVLLLWRTRGRSGVLWLAAPLLALLAVLGCAPSVPRTAPRPSGTARTTSPPAGAPTAVPAVGRPTYLTIPRLHISQSLDVISSAVVADLPTRLSVEEVAWLKGTSLAGEPGTTAIVGHSTFSGEGAFDRLNTLRPGDRIIIGTSAGGSIDYVVDELVTAAKTKLPASLWAPSPVSSLALISCTGPDVGGFHRDNLMAIALPLS